MPAKSGAMVLIKIGDGGDPELFTTIGGLRTASLILNNQLLDSSHVDSGEWKQLANSAGVKSLAVTGNGIFTDASSEEVLRQNAFASSVNKYQLFLANGDYVTGPFVVASYERSGSHDGAESYSIILESAGQIIFTNA